MMVAMDFFSLGFTEGDLTYSQEDRNNARERIALAVLKGQAIP
jgi:hypothetical protein